MNIPGHIDITFPKSFIQMTRFCETYCVSGCCGLEAFTFDRKTIAEAIDRYGIRESSVACDEASLFADELCGESRECRSDQDDFNHCWKNGAECALWIREIVQLTRESIAAKT